ncbi:cytochrome P450 [Cyathus striatus]|nr:cytochrome P450 [Cyathus striatus]
MNSIDLLVLVSCISLLLYVYIRKMYTLPLPPGPSGYPLIRNLLDIPATFQWEAFAEWSKAHGSDVVFAEAIGVRFISLNSVRAAEDLLTKRSTIYSSRYSKSMGWGFQFATMPYGEKWRERRRLFQKHFPTGRHDNYRPLLKHLVRILQLGLIEQPETFYERIQHMSGAFALVLGYGIKIQPINDPLVEFSKQTLGEGLRAGTPGRYLVDVIPALKYVPEWMPGAGFKRVAKMWYGLAQEFRNRPFEKGMDALAAGSSLTQSFLSMCISELPDSKDEQQELEAIKDAASMFYTGKGWFGVDDITGGSDTSVASMYVFVLAMTLFPEVQRKARNEIDEKIGGDRLPDFDDEPNLPYLTAVILEVLRWHPAVPMGVPHFLIQDDIYKGYRMPKQSMVVANTWAMAHDETDYPAPYNFNPDRFMKNGQIDPDVRDPRTFSFGFGRRICPGLHIGWSTVWYTAANLLATFEILKPLNDRGEETEPEIVYESGIVSPPLKFDCRFEPRSATREQVICAESNETTLY